MGKAVADKTQDEKVGFAASLRFQFPSPLLVSKGERPVAKALGWRVHSEHTRAIKCKMSAGSLSRVMVIVGRD